MKILKILESLYKDDFELIDATVFNDGVKLLSGTFTLVDETNDIKYMVDILIAKETNKYKIESISVTDGDQDHNGDNFDRDLINFYLSNNIDYVIKYILDNG